MQSSYKLDEFVAHGSTVECLSIGRTTAGVLATGGEDKKVNDSWIGQPKVCKSLSGLQSTVDSVTFDGAENQVAAGGANGTVKVWDLESGTVSHSFTGHHSICSNLEFHPCGPLLSSGSLDTNIKVWDLGRREAITTFKGHTKGVNKLAISPDGKWVCSVSETGEVKLWDMQSGRAVKGGWSHNNTITDMVFDPATGIPATSSTDETVKTWDLEVFQALDTLGPEATAVEVNAYHKNGKQLLTAAADALNVWGKVMPFCGKSLLAEQTASVNAGDSRQKQQQQPSHMQPLPQLPIPDCGRPRHEQPPPNGYQGTSADAGPSSGGGSTCGYPGVSPVSQISTTSTSEPAAGRLSRQLNRQRTPLRLPTGSSCSAGSVERPLAAAAKFAEEAAGTHTPSIMDHAGWQILLQHHSITSDQQLVALLLSTTPTAFPLIMSLCARQVPLRCAINDKQTTQHFSQWLQRHRGLAHSLDLHLEGHHNRLDQQHAASLIAAALQQSPASAPQADSQLQAAAVAGALPTTHVTAQAAAAAEGLLQADQLQAPAAESFAQAMQLPAIATAAPTAPMLQVQDFRLRASRLREMSLPTITTILQQLPSNHLTRLDLTVGYEVRYGPVSTSQSTVEDERAVHQALAQLTALRSSTLQLTRPEMVIPALASLTQLTDLHLDLHRISGLLHLLPASLVRLRILNEVDDLAPEATAGRIRLEHCSAITELSIHSVINNHDQLPPNVADLCITDLVSVQPLQQLRHLQVLRVECILNEGSELLRKLNHCTQLSCIKLGTCAAPSVFADYERLDVFDLSAAILAWEQIAALREVKFGNRTDFYLAEVQQFSSLATITRLELNNVEWDHDHHYWQYDDSSDDDDHDVERVTQQADLCASALRQCKGLQELLIRSAGREIDGVPIFGSRGDWTSEKKPDFNKLAHALTDLSNLRSIVFNYSVDLQYSLPAMVANQLTGLTAMASVNHQHFLYCIAKNMKGLVSLDISRNGILDCSDDALGDVVGVMAGKDCSHYTRGGVVGVMARNLTRLTQLNLTGMVVRDEDGEAVSAGGWSQAMPWVKQLQL